MVYLHEIILGQNTCPAFHNRCILNEVNSYWQIWWTGIIATDEKSIEQNPRVPAQDWNGNKTSCLYPWGKYLRYRISLQLQEYFTVIKGWVTQLCISELIIIGSDNGLVPGRHQVFIWTNDRILSIWPLGIIEILIEIHTFSFQKIHLQISSAKCRPFFLGLNMLRPHCKCFLTQILISIFHNFYQQQHFIKCLRFDVCESHCIQIQDSTLPKAT